MVKEYIKEKMRGHMAEGLDDEEFAQYFSLKNRLEIFHGGSFACIECWNYYYFLNMFYADKKLEGYRLYCEIVQRFQDFPVFFATKYAHKFKNHAVKIGELYQLKTSIKPKTRKGGRYGR